MATEPDPEAKSESGIGAAVQRVEDAELVSGQAEYTDDLAAPSMVHAAFLRSQQSHAKIHKINTSKAEAMDGVVAVFTYSDLEAADEPTPGKFRLYGPPFPGFDKPPEHLYQPSIANDKVRYQGEPIAIVIAEDRFTAYDAVEAVEVDYERLEPVVEPAEAIQDDAPVIHEENADNIAFDVAVGPKGDVDQAFDDAAYTASFKKDNQRIWSFPMEPRACLATFDPDNGHLNYQATTQIPHEFRRDMSHVLDYPENKIDVEAPNMGGGFGPRAYPYPEDALVGWAAKHLEQPVKWRSTRIDNQLVEAQARGIEAEAEIAIDNEGNITGYRMDALYDLGAWISGWAVGLAGYGSQLMTGQYDIPIANTRIRGVLTNTARVDAYRGVTEVEMIIMIERLVDRVARKADMDPAEVRRRNFIQPDQFPYHNPVGGVYDSGDYEANFDVALDTVNYEELRERQEELREEGRYIGIGISSWIEAAAFGKCGVMDIASWEYSNVQVHPTGDVSVYIGAADHGQGHKTSFKQVASEHLGVSFDDVEVIQNDTSVVPEGVGTYASRSAAVCGGSITKSAEKVLDKAQRIAAHQLEVHEEDIEYEDGEFYVSGAPDRTLTFRDVAEAAHWGGNLPEDMDPGLEAHTYYDPDNFTWPYGNQIAVVEIDPDTGELEFEKYVATEDCGQQINPMIVEGQIHGGTAQGIGQALYEGVQYDDQGNLITGTMMDYCVPKAHQIPEMELESTNTPSPHNPLGVKGVGEGGTIAAPAAVINAIEDALQPFDVDDSRISLPMTSEKIWRAIDEGGDD